MSERHQQSHHRRHHRSARNHDHGHDHDRYHRKHSSSSKHQQLLPNNQTAFTVENFFTHNSLFRAWMLERRGKRFDDQKSAENRKLFEKFISKYNNAELPSKYYNDEMDETLKLSSRYGRTSHKWSIKLDEKDQIALDSVTDAIDIATNAPTIDTTATVDDPLVDSSQKVVGARAAQASTLSVSKRDVKQWRKRDAEVLEELVPKLEGHRAKIEKRQMKGSYARGRDTEDWEYLEKDILGGGSDYARLLQSKREREMDHKVEKELVAAEKLRAYEEKEKQKMTELLASVGLSTAARIGPQLPPS